MERSIKALAGGAILAIGLTQQAHSALITDLVFKLSDSTDPAGGNYLNAETGWTGTGTLNEGNAAAQSLMDNGLDFKSSAVDSWMTATWTNVRVGMYSQGSEVAFFDFNPAGTTKNTFFALGNVTNSSWTDLDTNPINFFSVPGDSANDRNWFANRNYGGCAIDRGWLVAVDNNAGGQPCNWEDSRLVENNRAFLYSSASTWTNWNSTDTTGVADVLAVSITREVQDNGNGNGNGASVPAPATVALLAIGLLATGARSRRNRAHK